MHARMAPLIIAERRIILFLISFIAGIIFLHQLDRIWALGETFQHGISRHSYRRGSRGLAMGSGVLRFILYVDVFNYFQH